MPRGSRTLPLRALPDNRLPRYYFRPVSAFYGPPSRETVQAFLRSHPDRYERATSLSPAQPREFPAGGRLNVPVRRDFAQNEMDFFLDPTESAWNAECIRIHLSDGRVVSKEYSRD